MLLLSMRSFSYHAIGTFSADCSSHLTNQDRSAFPPCKRDADQNSSRGAMPDLHTASWACVMERNQPSRSSRQARVNSQPLWPLAPPPPNTTYLPRLPTHPHRTDGHIQRIRTPVQQDSYAAQLRSTAEHSTAHVVLRTTVPVLLHSSTTTAHTWQRMHDGFLDRPA